MTLRGWRTILLLSLLPLLDERTKALGDLPMYVGQRVCLTCHVEPEGISYCRHGALDGHRQAFAALTHPRARHIAALLGVTDEPTGSRLCLTCHAAGADVGPRWWAPTFELQDGVQCESCHGPGSLHVAKQRKGAPAPSPERRPSLIRRGSQADCGTCHIDRASHREVLQRGFRVSEQDRKYKTPVNLAIHPDGIFLYIVCENSGTLIVADTRSKQVVKEIKVGRVPFGVACSSDGHFVYVTNRFDQTMSVISTQSNKVVNKIAVGYDPHGVCLTADDQRAFVANTGENTISVIDLSIGREIRRIAAGEAPWGVTLCNHNRSIAVTHIRPQSVPFQQAHYSELTLLDATSGSPTSRLAVPDANMLQQCIGIDNRDAVLFTLVRTKNLVPITRLTQGWVLTYGLGVARSDGSIAQVLLDQPNRSFPDPMNLAVSPDGRHVLVSSGGGDEVAVVDVDRLLEVIETGANSEATGGLANDLGASSRFVVKRISVGANPRGVAFSPSMPLAFVANALDDTVSILSTTDLTRAGSIKLGGPKKTSELRRGARLFHSAATTFGRQFACRSCHPEGHSNGLTFDIAPDGLGMHPVDNRSLQGMYDTAPFKWEGTNPTLQDQCGKRFSAFFTRLAPFADDDLQALVRYIATLRRPPNRHRASTGLTAAQHRGKLIFEREIDNDGLKLRPEQRCVACHSGAQHTNRQSANLRNTTWFDAAIELSDADLENVEEFGRLGQYYFLETGSHENRLDVPHLTDVARTGPYLHNGAASTLEEIWTTYDVPGDHGKTDDLTRQQFNDLIAYLKAL